MINILTQRGPIALYQKQFIKILKTVCVERITCNVGFNGGSFETVVFYSPKYDFWFTHNDNENRFWNAFAIGKPISGRNVSIDVEINIRYEGVNRNIGGAFGQDEKGNVFVFHRGRIGGSKAGGGKQLFIDNYSATPIITNDNGVENYLYPIADLNSKSLPREVADFISEVRRIKNIPVKESAKFSWLNKFKFTDEPSGKGSRKQMPSTTISLKHGIVVNKLANILKSKGLLIGKDRNRDIFIHKRGHVRKLFEIKVSSSTQHLYSAVGQLLIYSIPFKNPADLILVLPTKLDKIVVNRLTELGLLILYYTWNDDEPVFQGLDKIL